MREFFDGLPYDFHGGLDRLLLAILQDDPVPIRSRSPEVPEALATVVHRTLAREPAERFPEAAMLRSALLPSANFSNVTFRPPR